MRNLKYDLTGQRFGRLVVICRATSDEVPDKNKQNNVFWKCKCDCGNTKFVSGGHLRDGHTQSCGCLHDENSRNVNKTHGKCHTRLHATWTNMLQRCTNPKNHKYNRYGERGICVCDEWRDFQNFYEWAMSNGYADELTIDRIDNNGNYEPSNCRWVDSYTQMNNTSTNKMLYYKDGYYSIADISRMSETPYNLLRNRLANGWGLEDAIKIPVRDGYKLPIICEDIEFESIDKCAKYYHIKPPTMRAWLKKNRIPKEFVEKGLRYKYDFKRN